MDCNQAGSPSVRWRKFSDQGVRSEDERPSHQQGHQWVDEHDHHDGAHERESTTSASATRPARIGQKLIDRAHEVPN